MKANELMIGDIVRVNQNVCISKGSIVRVLAIDGTASLREKGLCGCATCEVIGDKYHTTGGVWCEYLEPIPLSTEILEKNGWSYNDEDAKFAPETWSGGGLTLQGQEDSGFMIMATSDYDDEDTNHTPFILNYVHELQHALKLRRLSKEITIN